MDKQQDVEKIIKENVGLVYSIVNKHKCKSLSRDDLISFGIEGLYEASLNYNSNLGKFASYAYRFVEAAIIKEINATNNPFYLSSEARSNLNKIRNICNNLRNELEREPTYEEIFNASDNEFNSSYISSLLSINQRVLSISTNNEDDQPIEEFLASDDSPMDNYNLIEERERIKVMCSILNKQEYQIISMKLGINEYEYQLSDVEISKYFNITVSKVNRIFNEAKNKIKNKFKN